MGNSTKPKTTIKEKGFMHYVIAVSQRALFGQSGSVYVRNSEIYNASDIAKALADMYSYTIKLEETLRAIDNHIRCTSEPIDFIIQELHKTLPEYRKDEV